MIRTGLLIAAVLACALARPRVAQYAEPDAVPVAIAPASAAQGTSGGTITKSETNLPGGGTTNVVQQGSNTGGQASGGGFNVGSASTNAQSLQTAHGTTSTSDTDAQSVQGSSPTFQGLPGGAVPFGQQGFNPGLYRLGQQGFNPSLGVPAFPGGFPSPQAQGTSGSQITKSETVNPFGGTMNVVQQGSNTGGSASGGGFNVGRASSDSQSQQTPFGTSTTSDTDAQSVQGGGPAFPGGPGFTGGFPAGLQYPGQLGGCNPAALQQPGQAGVAVPIQGFVNPQAQGTSGSQITKSETVNPLGGTTNVVQQGSSTGGSASGGGFNVGSASSDSQSLQTAEGTSTKSDTDAQSVQGSGPAGAGGFPAGLQYPGQPGGCNYAALQQPGQAGFGVVPFPGGFGNPQAQGTSGSQITKSETVNPLGGTTNVVQQGSNTGGSASGGGFNVGSASSDSQSLQTAEGTSSTSNTDAQSAQGGGPVFPGRFAFPSGFSAPLQHPGQAGFGVVPFPGGFGNPQAQGTSGSQITKSETVNPLGGTTNVVQQGSNTGGSASGGGFNVGRASSGSQSQQTQFGTSTTSDTDAQSVQGSSPGFHGFNAGLQFPHGQGHGAITPGQYGNAGHLQGFQSFHGLNPNARGTSGSQLVKSETVNQFGGTEQVSKLTSGTGGSASGGGFNVGSASGDTQSLLTPHGTSTSSNTDAQSAQGAGPTFHGGFGFQGLPFAGFGSATGRADSGLTSAKTTGADGSHSTVTQLGSSAGGSASDGGTNVSKSSGRTSSVTTGAGTETQSHVDSESVQTGR
ncbi:hypothetical protein FJT64_024542 [Amphibalanus amphitrite]|uniref:Uncharacterized protein n=1 Tax=Amphibalanus amphitrite TaxID=1232801 RepID=A0A6A4W6P9_AMPAM|nr:hypothetical protein FJT64_024542 [Amphibalanus amphitrite]